jgi:hypothetical protein
MLSPFPLRTTTLQRPTPKKVPHAIPKNAAPQSLYTEREKPKSSLLTCLPDHVQVEYPSTLDREVSVNCAQRGCKRVWKQVLIDYHGVYGAFS